MSNKKNSKTNFKLNVCALASLVCTFAYGQTVNQSVDMNAGTAYIRDLPSGTPQAVTGDLSIGATNSLVTVTLNPAGVTLPADFILGGVASNSSTLLKVNDSRSTVIGTLRTEGQTLVYTLTPAGTTLTPYASSNFNVRDGAGSGKLTAGGLYMGGSETFVLNLAASLKNDPNNRYVLINSATPITYSNSPISSNLTLPVQYVQDNSYVINSTVMLNANGTVTYTATRGNDEYIVKSDTAGHFSNPAALALGTVAAGGYQRGDMVTAINTLDLDGNGFGNNLTNLATQVKRLAPVANNSMLLSVMGVGDLMNATLDHRLVSLRSDVPGRARSEGNDVWGQTLVRSAKQSGVDDYDGYRLRTSGLMMGVDRSAGNTWYGVTVGHASSGLQQTGFRTGDNSSMSSYSGKLYATHLEGQAYVEASLGYGFHALSGVRSTAINRVADYTTEYRTTELNVGGGYHLRLKDPGTTVTPFFNVIQTRVKQNAYSETGAGDLGLDYRDYSSTRMRVTGGLRYNAESRWGTMPAFTSMFVAWSKDNGFGAQDITANYQGLTDKLYTTFTTPVAPIVQDSIRYGASTSVSTSRDTTIVLGLQMEHNRLFNAYTGHAKAIWNF